MFRLKRSVLLDRTTVYALLHENISVSCISIMLVSYIVVVGCEKYPHNLKASSSALGVWAQWDECGIREQRSRMAAMTDIFSWSSCHRLAF
jgi:hypothetical protein